MTDYHIDGNKFYQKLKNEGEVTITNQFGQTTTWVWDWYRDRPVNKRDMTEEDLAKSNAAKWTQIKK